MDYETWAKEVEKARNQYFEGAITAWEYFNTVMAKAFEVNQTEHDESKPNG